MNLKPLYGCFSYIQTEEDGNYLESLVQNFGHSELCVAPHIIMDILGVDLNIITPRDQFHLLPTL